MVLYNTKHPEEKENYAKRALKKDFIAKSNISKAEKLKAIKYASQALHADDGEVE